MTPRFVLLAVAAVALAAPTATISAQQSATDTTHYVVLFPAGVTGYYNEWRTADGVIHSAYEYNDRGRGPHLEAAMRLGAHDVPTQLTVTGHAYLKDTVAEAFASTATGATWKNTHESGAKQGSAARGAFYIGSSESPVGTLQLVRAALALGGRVPMLPNGTATVTKAAELTIPVTGGAPTHVVLYDVGGLGFSPVPVWVDDAHTHFAIASAWQSIVPAGWEGGVPAMVAAQDAERAARYAQLARDLAHRQPAGRALVFRNARLFVAESASVRPHMTVVVLGNRITAVGRDGEVKIPANAQVVDATGKTLLPGLWDMHVHISPGDDGMLHIAGGITTARDMGNDSTTALSLQRAFAADTLIGPHLILAGLIDGSGPYRVPAGMVGDDSAQVVADVDWYAAHGYEQIKIYSSMKPELVPIIIAEAHAKGLRVSGHVPAYMTAEQVVRLGFSEIQHANFLMLNFQDSVKDTRSMARFIEVAKHGAELDFNSQRVKDFVTLLKTSGTDIDPTLVAFEGMFTARPGQMDPSEAAIADRMPAQVRRGFLGGGLPVPEGMDQRYRDSYRAMMKMVKTMFDAGVPVDVGTDAFPVGFAYHREMELQVAAGIPAPQVLRNATLGAATIMHHEAQSGSVAVGKTADLVLVSGNPATNISDIRRTALVVKDGIIYRPAELYNALGIVP